MSPWLEATTHTYTYTQHNTRAEMRAVVRNLKGGKALRVCGFIIVKSMILDVEEDTNSDDRNVPDLFSTIYYDIYSFLVTMSLMLTTFNALGQIVSKQMVLGNHFKIIKSFFQVQYLKGINFRAQ